MPWMEIMLWMPLTVVTLALGVSPPTVQRQESDPQFDTNAGHFAGDDQRAYML